MHKRQLLLKPSRRVNHVIRYVVAVLAERHDIDLHAFIAMSNHRHDVATDESAKIVDFQRDLHSVLARHINSDHGDFESLWANEQTNRVECVGPEAILDKIAYTLANPVEARLVEHGKSWPGVRRAWPAEPMKVERPVGFFRTEKERGRWPKIATLRFSRPPGFDHLPDDELSALIRERVEAREKQLREDARANGDTFLGRRAVRRQSRQSYPRSYEHRFRTVPTVACKSKWARIERLARKRDWQQDYAAARDAFCAGNRTVRFPYGTYKLRVEAGVLCLPPPA